MLRSLFISLSRLKWMQRAISKLPGASHAASRFVAGESIESAIRVVRDLNHLKMNATLDFLGENSTTLVDARLATQEVFRILEAIQSAGVTSNISIKLSQFGLGIDKDACRENLKQILTRARELENFIRIDMEDSSLTESTLEIFNWTQQQGFSNTGIVIQSYLYRSAGDIQALGAQQSRIRLCKGAYQEPANLAFPKKADVDHNYDQLARQMLEIAIASGSPQLSDDGCIPPLPAFATHDQERIKNVVAQVKTLQVPQRALEFQMLFGIRRDLQLELVQAGYPVRIYVPYGTRWYPYFMRRLAERPANIWFFTSNLMRK